MASLKSEAKKGRKAPEGFPPTRTEGRKAPEGLPPTRTEVPRETMAEVVKTFSARVADYVAVSALEDPKVSLRMADTRPSTPVGAAWRASTGRSGSWTPQAGPRLHLEGLTMDPEQEITKLRARVAELEDALRLARAEDLAAAKSAERFARGPKVSVAKAMATLRASQRGELRR